MFEPFSVHGRSVRTNQSSEGESLDSFSDLGTVAALPEKKL